MAASAGNRWEPVLQNPFRAAILERVHAVPGIRQSALAAELPCSRATVRHHLAALHGAGLLEVVSSGQHAAAFPPSFGAKERETVAVLQRGRSREVASLVAARPGMSQRELTGALRMSRRLFRATVDRLLAHGLVTERAAGRRLTYFPTAPLAPLLAPAAPGSSPSVRCSAPGPAGQEGVGSSGAPMAPSAGAEFAGPG